MTLVERLRDAVSASDDVEKLRALLELWRETPAPEIADMIDAISATLPARDLGLSGKKAAKIERWIDVVTADDPADLTTLLEAFPIGSLDEGRTQLEALAQRARDPRLPLGLLRKIEQTPPYRSESGIDFWRRVLELVVAAGDPRARLQLRKAGAAAMSSFRSPMNKWVLHWIRETGKLISNAPRIPKECVELLERWHEQWTESADRSPQQLLEAVYADPSDLGARAVYGDVLTERGDPHGEFITLQFQRHNERITKAGRKREKELFNAHWKRWIGDLSSVVIKTGLEFELGFPSVVFVQTHRDRRLRPLIGHPGWSTVREFRYARGSSSRDAEKLILDPVMRSLRVLHGSFYPKLITELCVGKVERQIHSFGIDGVGSQEGQDALCTASALPNLVHLELTGYALAMEPHQYTWLFDSALAKRLRTLSVRNHWRSIPAWIRIADERSFPKERLQVSGVEPTL